MSRSTGPYISQIGRLVGGPGTTQQDPDFIRQGQPAQTLRELISRLTATLANAAWSATGVAHATAIPLMEGDVITNITFVTATTAAVTPTAGFVALYDNQAVPALMAQSANFSTTARAANTIYTVPLQSQVQITVTGLYYISISFTAGTIPTGRGVTNTTGLNGAVIAGMPILAQSHGAAVGGVAPATITGAAASANAFYYVVS